MSEENKQKETLDAAMALVRCGWQMACDEFLLWCSNKKVSEQFTNQIIEMMDDKKKRSFDWVKLREEMESMGLKPKDDEFVEHNFCVNCEAPLKSIVEIHRGTCDGCEV